MDYSDFGFWALNQDQPCYLSDNIDPHCLLASGAWATSQCLNDPASSQLAEDVDRSMYSEMVGDDWEDLLAFFNEDEQPSKNLARSNVHASSEHPNRDRPVHEQEEIPAPGSRVPPSFPPSLISRPLRPEAIAFRPAATGQEHWDHSATYATHTASVDGSFGSNSSSHWSGYSTPVSVDSGSTPMLQIPHERTIRVSAIQRAAHQSRVQRLKSPANRRRNHSRHSQMRSTEGSPASAIHSDVSPVHPVNTLGWEPGLASSEDITAWSQGTYTPAEPQCPSNNGISPLPYRLGLQQEARSPTGSTVPFFCSSEGCPKVFPSKSDLDHHERYHGPRKHSCSLCSRSFIFPKDLKRHMKTHSQERHLFCTDIGCQYHVKGFQRDDHLKRHAQNAHGTVKRSR